MKNKGQIMLLSILILGGVMIGAATIGSFLLRFQIDQVNNAGDSTKALFAADAGIEAVSWCFFDKSTGSGECDADSRGPDTFCPEDNSPSVSFDDSDIELETRCRWDKNAGVVTITSQGFKASTTRILEAEFQQSN